MAAEIDTPKKAAQVKRIIFRLDLREGWREASKETPMDTRDWVGLGLWTLGILVLVSMLVFKLT